MMALGDGHRLVAPWIGRGNIVRIEKTIKK